MRGQINQNEAETFDLKASVEARPLSKREVNKILKAHVKQAARDISAVVNGDKEIVLIDDAPPSKVFKVVAPSHDDNKADTKMSGKLISGRTRILVRPLSDIADSAHIDLSALHLAQACSFFT